MKIGLIQPSRNSGIGIPVGLGYIASYLKQYQNDIYCSLLDTGISSHKEIHRFLNNKADVIGISSTYRTFNEPRYLAKEIKQQSSNTFIVIGGPHVSIMYDKVLEESSFDFAVYGEGEVTFNELVNTLKAGIVTGETLRAIDGLIFRDGNKTVINRRRELIPELDSIPYPAYDLFKIDRYYLYPIITGRGCPFNCVFCASGEIWGRNWRKRSIDNVISEVKSILANYPKKVIVFSDDSFNVDLKRVHAFCEKIIEERLNIIWYSGGFRIDRVDLETAKAMARAGCVSVSIGVESANPGVLKNIKKGFNIEDVSKNIKVLREGGIRVYGQFMIGNPGDTLETIKESIRFAKNSGLSRINFYTAQPFPTTKLWDFVMEHGRFLVEPDVTGYDEVKPGLIFETDDFPKIDRLEAVELARKAGYLSDEGGPSAVSLAKKLKKFIKSRILGLRIGRFDVGYQIYPLLLAWSFKFRKIR